MKQYMILLNEIIKGLVQDECYFPFHALSAINRLKELKKYIKKYIKKKKKNTLLKNPEKELPGLNNDILYKGHITASYNQIWYCENNKNEIDWSYVKWWCYLKDIDNLILK